MRVCLYVNAGFAQDIDIGVDTGYSRGEDENQSNTIISNRKLAGQAHRVDHGGRQTRKFRRASGIRTAVPRLTAVRHGVRKRAKKCTRGRAQDMHSSFLGLAALAISVVANTAGAQNAE